MPSSCTARQPGWRQRALGGVRVGCRWRSTSWWSCTPVVEADSAPVPAGWSLTCPSTAWTTAPGCTRPWAASWSSRAGAASCATHAVTPSRPSPATTSPGTTSTCPGTASGMASTARPPSSHPRSLRRAGAKGERGGRPTTAYAPGLPLVRRWRSLASSTRSASPPSRPGPVVLKAGAQPHVPRQRPPSRARAHQCVDFVPRAADWCLVTPAEGK